MPEPAALSPVERKVARAAVRRRARRRAELVAELRVGEALIAYATRQLSNGIGPEEAREIALEASAQLSMLSVALRKSVRLAPAHRRVLVGKLAGLGYTQEAIVLRVGVSVKTVQRDLAARRQVHCRRSDGLQSGVKRPRNGAIRHRAGALAAGLERPMTEPSREHQADCLRTRFPRWRVWYVPNAVTRSASWHAQPGRYPLDAADPEDLADAIEADEADEAAGLPHDDDHGWA